MPLKNTSCKDSRFEVHSRTMYAIAFDLEIERLKTAYHNDSYQNAYKEIESVLAKHDFSRQQGSVYFGDRTKVTAVSCMLAVTDLVKSCPWFSESVRDIRMLRIDDDDDLMPIVKLMQSSSLSDTPTGQPSQVQAERVVEF